MCGVLGYAGPSDPDLIKALFLENNIRGQHATGISWVEDGKIESFILAGPASQFLKKVPAEALSATLLIGHSRYSTSDLRYNQPIFIDDISVVHNGVLTQEATGTWQNTWGFACVGKNDTELLLHAMVAYDEGQGEHPMALFEDGSIAACVLTSDKLRFFRNGKRPLWVFQDGRRVIVTSTRDILNRVLDVDPVRHIKCAPFRSFYAEGSGAIDFDTTALVDSRPDLQDL